MKKDKSKDTVDILYTTDKSGFITDQPNNTEGNAGSDLRSAIDWKLMPGETKLIPTSLKMIIPDGHVGMVCSRSGIAMKNSVFVMNSPGIIDPSYRGTWGIILHNASRLHFNIKKNDRIAQVVFVKYSTPNFILRGGEDFSIDSTPRGEGGFGSTGIE